MASELQVDVSGWAARKTAQNGQKPKGRMIFKSIRDRLGNWATWSRGGSSRGGMTMTAIVCSSMRRAALGDVWSGYGAGQQVDPGDAELVERAWKELTPLHRDLLRWIYIRNAEPGMICRRLGIKPRPTSIFDIELKRAEAAIEAVISRLGHGPVHKGRSS